MPPSELEVQFHRAMLRIYDDAKSLANYNATRYRSMVAAHGGLEAARILVRADTVSDGYIALWERGHLELTVEALILKPEWHPLFTSEERAIARERLRKYEYQGDLGEG